MAQSSKKQNFLHGAALLAIATALVKVIGALYKIPLKMVIGDQGFGYFSTAYQIYSVLLMISTAGFPIAMSRIISQASSLGNYNQVRKIFKTARGIFLGIGTVSTLLMVLFCRQLAAFQEQPDAWAAVLCLGPCALLMGFLSTYRGFFQGQGNMLPTSISQVLEAVVKLIVGLVAAFAIMRMTNNVGLAAAGAILGVTSSCLVSALFMRSKFAPAYRELPTTQDEADSYGKVAKALLAIAIPITIGSAGLQLLTLLETKLYMGQLLTANGLSQDTADTMKGIYDMAQTIFNMPCAFIIPITISVIPAVTEQLTLGNHTQVNQTEESAARITGLLSLPCTVGLALLASPVMALLGDYSGEKLALASSLMLRHHSVHQCAAPVPWLCSCAGYQYADLRCCPLGGGILAGGQSCYWHSGRSHRRCAVLLRHRCYEPDCHPQAGSPEAEAPCQSAALRPAGSDYGRGGLGMHLGDGACAAYHQPCAAVRRTDCCGCSGVLRDGGCVQSCHPGGLSATA